MAEELDYRLEAAVPGDSSPRPSPDDPDFARPARRAPAASSVLVTEWLDGTPLSRIIAAGTAGASATAPAQLLPASSCSPARQRAGLLHADPHPGNFRLTAGRPARRPRLRRGQPAARRAARRRSAGCSRLALDGDAEGVLDGPARRGLRQARRIEIDAEAPARLPRARSSTPLRADTFHFTRAWLRGLFAAHQRPAAARSSRVGLQAQPAAGVPADPPGVARRHRRAVPDRGHRRRPGDGQRVDAARRAAAARR